MVPGGWLVVASETDINDQGGVGVGICFYPDAGHEWSVEEDE